MAELSEMSRAELLEEAKSMGYIGISAYNKADLLDLVKKERASLARAAAREAKKAEQAKAERTAAKKAKAATTKKAEPKAEPASAPAPEPAQTTAGFVSPRYGSGRAPTRHDHMMRPTR